jgi:hypothetical protein
VETGLLKKIKYTTNTKGIQNEHVSTRHKPEVEYRNRKQK